MSTKASLSKSQHQQPPQIGSLKLKYQPVAQYRQSDVTGQDKQTQTGRLIDVNQNLSNTRTYKFAQSDTKGYHDYDQQQKTVNSYNAFVLDKQETASKKQYSDVLLKYKLMAGKQRRPSNKQKQKPDNEESPQMLAREQIKPKDENHQLKLLKIQQPKSIQQNLKKVKISVAKQERTNADKINRQTHIRFIAQKQHDREDIIKNKNISSFFSVEQINEKMLSFSLIKSSSLPQIGKQEMPQKIRKQPENNKLLNGKANSQKEAPDLTIAEKIQKDKMLNSLAFMLTNLRQNISDKHDRRMTSSRISSISNYGKIKSTSRDSSFYSEISPTKHNKSRLSVIQFSKAPSSTMSVIQRIRQQNKDQMQSKQKCETAIGKFLPLKPPNVKQTEKSQKKDTIVKNQVSTVDLQLPVNNMSKLAVKNEYLEQIKQDIENENNQKEQLLREHRSKNKNLQIHVLEKKQRIARLQAQIHQFQDYGQSQQQSRAINQNPNSFLQQQKLKKQKEYKLQRVKLREQISQMEHKIKEQEIKYNTLRQSQLKIKDDELQQKQQQFKEKHQKMTSELSVRTKQLQEIIKREQQKSQIFKAEIQAHTKRNEQISRQLQKQEILEALLLQQVEKMAKQRQRKHEKMNEQKNKEKQKLLQDIKKLQQTQNKMIMEYQRDTQVANNIFEAMRMKNIQLEYQIKMKKQFKSSQDLN